MQTRSYKRNGRPTEAPESWGFLRVTGGGGQSLTELADCSDDHPERVAGEAVHHFIALELTDSLNVTAIDADGEVIDEFSLGLP